MESRQIIYRTERLLANPRVFMAIADYFEGPDWETFADAFYELIEAEFTQEGEDIEPTFSSAIEVCFREKPENPVIFQVILSTGNAIELQPSEDGERWAVVQDADDLAVSSAIYGRLVRAIEEARPDLKGDISLTEVPVQGNGYLRGDEDAFTGEFHLLSEPETKFGFVIEIVDIEKDELKATVTPK